jgi:hypothetical protein
MEFPDIPKNSWGTGLHVVDSHLGIANFWGLYEAPEFVRDYGR